MRQSMGRMAGFVVLCGVLVAGCAGDVSKQLVSDAELQARVMEVIGGNSDLASTMVDKLLSGDTRQLVMDKVLADGEAVQLLMVKIAQDPTMLDGVINVAVQDSMMRAHVMTLFKGMQMMRGK